MTSRSQVALDRVREHLLDVMGETVRGLMVEPHVTDIILNPPLPGEQHGRLWVARLGHEREPVGFMPADQAIRFIGAVAATMNTEVTEANPNVQGHLITDGSRFQGNIPPIVAGPFFAIRRHASAVFPLQSYVDKGLMTWLGRKVAPSSSGSTAQRSLSGTPIPPCCASGPTKSPRSFPAAPASAPGLRKPTPSRRCLDRSLATPTATFAGRRSIPKRRLI